jgi:hypothetical protein
MFTKTPNNYYDFFAIREDAAPSSSKRYRYNFGGPKTDDAPELRTRIKGSRETDGRRMARSVWHIPVASSRIKHFAMFPPELPERCIRVGSSEGGVCVRCGSPWTRVIQKERVATRPGADTKTAGRDAEVYGNRDPERHVTTYTSQGFEAGCDCGVVETRPDVVLDPFSGSGTTAMVAMNLGRTFIGCELNPEYHAASLLRLNEPGDIFNAADAELPPELTDSLEAAAMTEEELIEKLAPIIEPTSRAKPKPPPTPEDTDDDADDSEKLISAGDIAKRLESALRGRRVAAPLLAGRPGGVPHGAKIKAP